MGICQTAVENRGKIFFLRKKYPLYHETTLMKESSKYLSDFEIELWEHYLKFTEYKEELLKSNPNLHQQLFEPKLITETLEVDNIRSDYEEKVFFFINKRRFKELTILNSQITFPCFSFQLFPRYKEDKSTLTSLIINNSSIRMDEQTNHYSLLEDVDVLEISFCSITVLPEAFGLIKNVKRLCFRRNNLKTLPKSFDSLRELEYLDLSENEFSVVPKEIFSHGYKLLTLNLSGNQLECFEFIATTENYLLEFLFLSRNKLTKVPFEIRKLKNIKYVNLDENLINERTHNLNEEIPLNTKISCLKNKGINEVIELIKSDVMKPKAEEPERSRNTMVKEPIEKDKKSENQSQQSSALIIVPLKTITDVQQTKDCLLEALRINHTHTELEAEISKFLDKIINQIINDSERKDIESEKQMIKEEQYIFMMEKLEALINSGREKEITLIENFSLKALFKQCYGTYLKVQEFHNNGVLPCTMEEMHPCEKNYFIKKIFKFQTNSQANQELNSRLQEIKQNNKIKKREDISNLIFLKQLNQMIASSKIKLFLQYLGNIDRQIKEFLIALGSTVDNNSFILLLTEMKLLLKEMLDYYEEKNKEGLFNIRYETILSETKSVIHEYYKI